MPFRRFWWVAVLSFVVTTLISLLIFTNSVLVQAQNTSSVPTIKAPQWEGYSGRSYETYRDAYTACKKEYELLDAGYSSKTLERVEFDKEDISLGYLGYVKSAKCLMKWEGGAKSTESVRASCPDITLNDSTILGNSTTNYSYYYSGGNGTDGFCVLSSKKTYSNVPDFSPCKYYDNISEQYQCKYHKAAANICRGNYRAVNAENFICNLIYGNKLNEQSLNCIRSCLVEADKTAQSQTSCLTQSAKNKHCTKSSCIQDYHNACFTYCGVPTDCYGGNWWAGQGWLYINYNDDK